MTVYWAIGEPPVLAGAPQDKEMVPDKATVESTRAEGAPGTSCAVTLPEATERGPVPTASWPVS